MADTPFPSDLLRAQLALHQARADFAALCPTLPWSVDPMPGWPGDVHPHTGAVTGGREDSPGWTDEQKTEHARLLDLIRDLSAEVTTHSYWRSREPGDAVVKARMALKQHPDVQLAPAQAA
ncbi:hypothetical protein ABZ946_34030 [Streptomyces sp. NPDC046324]|uniref:hypothetical protein n=1 Tax=Streptomyces sp. NPDC046324 TaxID=3154915 RepID=UPI00340481B3